MLSHSAVMAAGTTLSRLSGFVRAALLSAALGAGLHADIFTVSNTLPNMLYILLAAMALGFTISIAQTYLSLDTGRLIFFGLVGAILLVRPRGLLGRAAA